MSRTQAGAVDLIVLCGGFGTRLRSAVSDRPKSMAMIGERPFLDFILEHFAQRGVERIVLCTGYMGDYIEQWYAGTPRPCEVVLSQEASPMGTAGALRQAAPLIRTDPFIVANGDSLLDVDPNELLEFHAAKRACVTVTLVNAGARADVGFVALDGLSRITAFSEKRPEASSKYHNAGVYVIQRGLLDRIPGDRPCSLETDVLPSILSRGVFGFVTDASLYDIGTPERLAGFRLFTRTWSRGARPERADMAGARNGVRGR
jgi:NDP-sugar pyrophosphorylase family protein